VQQSAKGQAIIPTAAEVLDLDVGVGSQPLLAPLDQRIPLAHPVLLHQVGQRVRVAEVTLESARRVHERRGRGRLHRIYRLLDSCIAVELKVSPFRNVRRRENDLRRVGLTRQ